MEIKILGPGCPKCDKTEALVKEVLNETGKEAEVIKVKDIMEIAKHGVMLTPAVIVDGDVKTVGKIPGKDEIKSWIL